MSDMGDMIKEILVGDEMFDESRGRKTLEEAMDKFRRRGRTQRIIYWLDMILVIALVVFSAIKFFEIDSEVATADHVLWGVLFSTGIAASAMLKIWFFNAHGQLELMKSQKRMEFRLLEELSK